MKRPTRDDCLRLLAAQADPVAEPPFRWTIFGVAYTEEDALQRAELCLLTGQDLSLVDSAPALLDLARRLADLEEAFAVHDSARRPRRNPVLPQSGVAQPSDGGWI